jgi:hypothetical protein
MTGPDGGYPTQESSATRPATSTELRPMAARRVMVLCTRSIPPHMSLILTSPDRTRRHQEPPECSNRPENLGSRPALNTRWIYSLS